METIDQPDQQNREEESTQGLLDLLAKGVSGFAHAGVVIGRLEALTENDLTPLVSFHGQAESAPVVARTTVELHGTHVGSSVVLMFEAADPHKPIILGILRDAGGRLLHERPGAISVDADGERLTLTAKDQLILQCGKARIILTRAGKVLIEGTYISSRSSGVNRVKGGAVHLN